MANPLIIVGAYCIVLLIFLIVSIIKASHHMKYLQEVFPKQYGIYNTYFSVFTPKKYNVGLQFLFLPFFKRYSDEEDANSKLIAKRVRKYQYISFIFLMILILPIVIGILQ
ncbi:MAG: hypothetical protein HRU40_19580 [Saprospiraceae bacterium]|nr:hypothetical protein [Saprospiraceae bacterium]